MIVLDTNVVSEAWRPTPSTTVLNWLESQPVVSLYLCTPVLAELRYGFERLEASRRKDRLRAAIEKIESEAYRDRILPFDSAAATEFGRLAAMRERSGRRIEPMDALIAAIALAHRAALATRDVEGFAGLGLEIIDPFNA
jgi:predicted nucleic acid-binding protein